MSNNLLVNKKTNNFTIMCMRWKEVPLRL